MNARDQTCDGEQSKFEIKITEKETFGHLNCVFRFYYYLSSANDGSRKYLKRSTTTFALLIYKTFVKVL